MDKKKEVRFPRERVSVLSGLSLKKKELSQRTKKTVRKNELSVLADVDKATFTMGATEFAWFPVSVESVFDIRDKKPLVSRLSKTPV